MSEIAKINSENKRKGARHADFKTHCNAGVSKMQVGLELADHWLKASKPKRNRFGFAS